MNNHIFEFDGIVYLQENEGSTGVRLSGMLAEIVMIFWCQELSKRLEKAGIVNDLIPRFVDDNTPLPTVIPPGMRLVDGELRLDTNLVKEDEKVQGDERTMIIIQDIANNINENIQVTFDVPSNYSDNKVPILDVKAGIDSENKIEFLFYKKPMTNNLVTMKSSAMSMNQKMAILTQQCFTRLHNTSDNTRESEKVEILNCFMQDLKASGYSESERSNVLKGGMKAFRNIKIKEFLKIRPFYRSNSFEKVQRETLKNDKKKNWSKGKKCDSNFKSVMFVDATPGDTLLKMMKATEERFMIAEDKRIKFISKSGTKLVNIFEKKNPFERLSPM